MLKLLLDEHISPAVAAGLRRPSSSLAVSVLAAWEGGSFLGLDDAAILREAAAQGWTLATYDLRTIPPLLKSWAEAGEAHGGVIFVDGKTVAPSGIGGLVRALDALADEGAAWDWTGRVVFLRR